MRNLETSHNIHPINMDEAARITALAFGRDNDELNYNDTRTHLESADIVQQVLDDEENLLAYTAYRRQLWQAGN